MKGEKDLQRLESKLTRFQAPHTYAIIFFVIIVMWLLTFVIPAGKFTTHDVEFTDASGALKTKTVLIPETFRYAYNLDTAALENDLTSLSQDTAKLEELGIDQTALSD
ncbi:MAG TPA: hypothetical protein VM577_02235, partial [Anaerovoracaceae bacterium]|nr:hypothetical protein [Anaerovoracaceae bacterium]